MRRMFLRNRASVSVVVERKEGGSLSFRFYDGVCFMRDRASGERT